MGAQFFGPQDVGINIYSYLPKYTTLSVTGGFNIGGATDTDATYKTTTLQVGDDVSWVRGKHQISFGANMAHWNSNTYARVLAMGQLTFNGQATGFGLADFLTGNLFSLAQAPPNTLLVRRMVHRTVRAGFLEGQAPPHVELWPALGAVLPHALRPRVDLPVRPEPI